LTNSKRPVESPEDMVGLKLRTMPTPVPLAFFKMLGANPTPMNFGEVFTALQQGVVDGQENPWETILANKFYEVQKYATNTGHVYSPFGVLFSQKFWDKLPAEYQEDVREAVFAARDFNRTSAREAEQAILAELGKYMEITILTPEEIKPFQEMTRPVYDQFAEEIGPELVQKAVDFLANL
jgi:tripartite ATP-independent transporter DctP family solute receptor